MESNFDLYSLIIKYLKKEIKDAELFKLNEWLKSDEKNLNEFNEIKDSWIFSNSSDESTEVEEALEIFNKKVEPSLKTSRNNQWFFKAASIALLLVSSFFIYMYLKSNNDSNIEQLAISTPEVNTVEIPIGEKGLVTLSDGTKVWLNSGSKLTYPSSFSKGREVTFEGEAYFDVVTNNEIPFYVKTNDITVMVTGTEFNIKNYPEDETVTTTLVEGIVKILDNKKGVTQISLKPNEVATFNKTEKSFILQDIAHQKSAEKNTTLEKIQEINPSVETITSWKENHLIFENETLAEMVKKMERWFGVNFILDLENSNERYSGKFVYNESIDQVLYVLSRTTPIKYKIEKNNVILSAK